MADDSDVVRKDLIATLAKKVMTKDATETDVLELLHELSMARGVPHVAAFGRLQKNLAPIFLEWVNDEGQRGSEPAHLAQAVNETYCTMLFSLILRLSPGEHKKAVGLAVTAIGWLEKRLDHYLERVGSGDWPSR